MVTGNAITLGTRAGAFGMKFTKSSLRFLKKHWKGITGSAGTSAGVLWVESELTDDDIKAQIQGFHAEELSDDEKDYAVQSAKDTVQDIESGEIFVPFSRRENDYINPTHIVTDLVTGRSWMTNNYISPSYVKALRRNTVSRNRLYRRRR